MNKRFRNRRSRHSGSGGLYLILILILLGIAGVAGACTTGMEDSDSPHRAVTVASESESASESTAGADADAGRAQSTAGADADAGRTQTTAGADADAGRTSDVPSDSSFRIYFIDVGQGDAALIQCDGASMLIDGGNSDHSRTMYAFLKAHDVTNLKYVIATHPDADHIGGLSGALQYASVETAFCSQTEYDTVTFQHLKKALKKQNISLTVPKQGQTLQLGNAKITILSSHLAEDDSNNNSIVCRIVYGKTSFLFTGDAETEEENAIMESGLSLKSTVLKVAHHGSNSSTSTDFLKAVSPEDAVISVGEDNDYGHPTQETLDRIKKAGATVYRTDLQGTILCESDGKKVTFSVSQNEDANTFLKNSQESQTSANGTESGESTYILNIGSMKFHKPGCSAVDAMSEKNKKIFKGTREEVIEKGYSPCGICNP